MKKTGVLRWIWLGLAASLLGCGSIFSQPEEPLVSETFPVDRVETVTLPNRPDPFETQLAYCSYSNYVAGFGMHWEIKVSTLDGAVVYDLETFRPSPTGDDDGCWGPEGIAITSLVWSPDGLQLLYQHEFVTTLRTHLHPSGESREATVLLTPPKYVHYLAASMAAWSPDGEKIAFTASKSARNYTLPSLFITSADGKNIRQITNETALSTGGMSLTWSHDSNKLAYILPEPDNGIGIVDLNTDTVTKFNADNISVFPKVEPQLDHDLSEKNIAWLPGDRLILFVTRGNDRQHDLLWVMEPDGTNLQKLYEGDLHGIALSPDGKLLAMVVAEPKGNYTIKTLSLDATPKLETLLDTATWPLSTNEGAVIRDLEWSPDGTRLIFASDASGNYDLFVWDTVLQDVVQVTDTPVDEAGPRWRPPVQQ